MGNACVLPEGVNIIRTGESRVGIDFNWLNIPEKLKVLFSLNVDVKDDRIYYLPVGLERKRWNPQQKKQENLFNMMNTDIEPSKLVYLNIAAGTNIQSRPKLIEVMKDKSWCTNDNRGNGSDYMNFITNIKEHKFVFSPDGNSLEGHRTWETLYLGRIPIIERHVFTEYFAERLPLLIVDNWEDVTEEFLNDKYNEMINKEWDWDLLKNSYWKTYISGVIDNVKQK